MVSLLNLHLLFESLPLVFAAFLLAVTMFSHVKMLWVSSNTIAGLAAIVGAVFGFVFFYTMYSLNVKYSVYVQDTIYVVMGVMAILVVLAEVILRRMKWSFPQITGLALFLASFYFLLA